MATRILLAAFCALLLAGCQPAAHKGVYHTVERGQTLYRISKVYEVDERHLARINGITDPTQLRVGDQIFIPGAESLRPVPATVGQPGTPPGPAASAPAPAASATPAPPRPAAGPRTAPTPPASPPATAKAPTVKPPSPPAARRPAPEKGRFAWPLQGAIVRRFGQQNGESCKGVQIAATRGTPVLAAAAGKVTYSGDGIRGYGNLIIVKHDEVYFTVYGFNERNLVEVGTYVSKGQRIALSGVAPDGGPARLHFEIRRGKEAVDPIFYLP